MPFFLLYSDLDIDLYHSSGSIISSTDNFKAWWKTVATEFASNDKVIFDTSKAFFSLDRLTSKLTQYP